MQKDRVLFRRGFLFAFFISHGEISSIYVSLAFNFQKTFKTLLVVLFSDDYDMQRHATLMNTFAFCVHCEQTMLENKQIFSSFKLN